MYSAGCMFLSLSFCQVHAAGDQNHALNEFQAISLLQELRGGN